MTRRRPHSLFSTLFLLIFFLSLLPTKTSWGASYQELFRKTLSRPSAAPKAVNSLKVGLGAIEEVDVSAQTRDNNRSRQEFLQRLGENSNYQDEEIAATASELSAEGEGISAAAPVMGVSQEPWWKYWKHKESGGPQPFNSQLHCGIPALDAEGEVLNCWLDMHATVLQHLVWREVNELTGQVQTLMYPSWPPAKKAQLAEAVYHAYQWLQNDLENFSGTPLVDPPPNQLSLKDWDYPCNRFSKEDAWKLYLATIAHSLALEISGLVPWSFLEYSDTDLDILLNSKYFFASGDIVCNTYADQANTVPDTYHFFGYANYGYENTGRIIQQAPTTGFNFLVQNNLIGSNHLKTLTKLLEWSRPMYHYLGGYSTSNVGYYWHYRGGVPAIRVMEGTEVTDPKLLNSYVGVFHWTAGCRGTSGFYRALLRNVNIPVQVYQDECAGHVMPIFWTVQKALDHGDNPYSDTWITTPPISAQNLLISIPQFKDWFSNGNCFVSRQLAEIAVKYISNPYLELYCDDVKKGLSHSQGQVFHYLSYFFTMAELNEKQFWSRIGDKAQQLGYCTPPNGQKLKLSDLDSMHPF